MFYHAAASMDRGWSSPLFNLGLEAKRLGQWKQSLAFNQRAAQLNPEDEAAWWNLGIAATALHNWREARRAWRAFGIELPKDDDNEDAEFLMDSGTCCVRLNPEDHGEVVWARRIDPARAMITSIPLIESNHRFRDIVLNDGAPNGTRNRNGREVSVFDELELWEPSQYSTFGVALTIPDESAMETLVELAVQQEMNLEDWSTVRMICAQCSKGNPGPHECSSRASGHSQWAFGAQTKEALETLLMAWSRQVPGAKYESIQLLLAPQ